MAAEHGWRTGDHILLRDVVRGRVRSAVPTTIVEHGPNRLVLFVCPGTTFMLPADWDRKLSRDYFADPGHVESVYAPPGQLMIMDAGARHSVLVRWHPDWSFAGWYVNLQSPAKRSAFGIDITDQMLDVVVSQDGRSYEWKDEAELARAVECGFVSADDAQAIRAEGERVVEAARRGDLPFSEPWPEWRPDPAWGVPPLPEGWATVG
jgi:hypothetical protein